VPLSEPSANATEKLIRALEGTLAELMKHAEPEHRFRFVSAAQSLPYATAYALWIKNGEIGPQPVASIAEMRAAVYDQAESASELRAFRKVAAVASVELTEKSHWLLHRFQPKPFRFRARSIWRRFRAPGEPVPHRRQHLRCPSGKCDRFGGAGNPPVPPTREGSQF
jgi:hypothetical protein